MLKSYAPAGGRRTPARPASRPRFLVAPSRPDLLLRALAVLRRQRRSGHEPACAAAVAINLIVLVVMVAVAATSGGPILGVAVASASAFYVFRTTDLLTSKWSPAYRGTSPDGPRRCCAAAASAVRRRGGFRWRRAGASRRSDRRRRAAAANVGASASTSSNDDAWRRVGGTAMCGGIVENGRHRRDVVGRALAGWRTLRAGGHSPRPSDGALEFLCARRRRRDSVPARRVSRVVWVHVVRTHPVGFHLAHVVGCFRRSARRWRRRTWASLAQLLLLVCRFNLAVRAGPLLSAVLGVRI